MAEALVALGLASNIIQFLSFAGDLISKSREVYHSADGSLVENQELETITISLQNLTSGLALPPSERRLLKTEKQAQKNEKQAEETKDQVEKTEKQLRELCNGCREVSEKLLKTVRGLKAHSSHPRWNSFWQAINSVLKESEIEALYSRLERYRRQLDTTLLVSIREQIIRNADSKTKSIDTINQSLLESVNETKQWQRDVVDLLHRNSWKSNKIADQARFSSQLSEITEHQRQRHIRSRILGELAFIDMEDRFEAISKAHQRTFSWMLHDEQGTMQSLEELSIEKDPKVDPQWSNFVKWLQEDDKLYWITGKPGCGKSTLMKYLFKHEDTQAHLLKWAGDSQLLIGGYFFWNSGTAMQMSTIGLLQTLLHQAIDKFPDRMPMIFAERWRSYELFGGDLRAWSMAELARAFNNLVSDDLTQFVFFIDGLDEFDGDGSELVDFLQSVLLSRPNVKICVASRPWLVFEDAFKCHPSLRLEDLTRSDIRLFASESLEGNSMFCELARLHPSDAKSLVQEVTEKASGVFLWVRLVVLSLLEGLRDGDTIPNLRERLNQLPPDLDDLFKKILNRLNPSYLKEASQIFQLVHVANRPLSLLALSFAEGGLETAIKAAVQPLPLDEIRFRAETMRRRLNSRCKGLIEAPSFTSEGAKAKVQFLHRTVKDFLTKADIQGYLVSATDDTFDPSINLCGAFLLNIKTMKCHQHMLIKFWSAVNEFDKHWKLHKERAANVDNPVLDELDCAASTLFRTKIVDDNTPFTGLSWLQRFSPRSDTNDPDYITHWSATEGIRYKGKDKVSSGIANWRSSIFDFAFHRQWYEYIKYWLANGYPTHSKINDRPLLNDAVNSMDIRVIRLLFEFKADPNFRKRGITTWTPWHYVLRSTSGATFSKTDPGDYLSIIELFVNAKANPRINVDGKTPEEIIKKSFNGKYRGQRDALLRQLSNTSKLQERQEQLERQKRQERQERRERRERQKGQKGQKAKKHSLGFTAMLQKVLQIDWI